MVTSRFHKDSQGERVVVEAVKTGMSPTPGPEILGCRPQQSQSLKKHRVMAQ